MMLFGGVIRGGLFISRPNSSHRLKRSLKPPRTNTKASAILIKKTHDCNSNDCVIKSCQKCASFHWKVTVNKRSAQRQVTRGSSFVVIVFAVNSDAHTHTHPSRVRCRLTRRASHVKVKDPLLSLDYTRLEG